MKHGCASRVGSLAALLCCASCNAFTGVDDVEFAPAGAPATSGSGGGGATGAQGGSGGGGLSGGGGGLSGDGAPCVTASTCASGSCADGVCCGSPCDGICEACVAAKTGAPDGTCAAVTTGTDPDLECGDGQTCCGSACGSCGGEDCTNSVDDDLDGKIDCEDEQCAAFECVPAPPGNTDLAIYWVGAGPAPGCPGSFPTETAGGIGVVAPPPECNACTCGGSTGAACGVATVTFYEGGNCGGGPTIVGASPSVCTQVPNLDGIDSVLVGAIPVSGGSCAPGGGGVASQRPWTWQSEAVVCEAAAGSVAGGGCGAGQICAPVPAPPFEAKICAVVPNGACSDPYSEIVTVHTSVDDQRTCTDCSCGAPAGSTCTGGTVFYDTPGCTNAKFGFQNDGMCHGQNGFTTVESIQVTAMGPTPGACPPSGGDPVGAAVPAGPSTLCCVTAP